MALRHCFLSDSQLSRARLHTWQDAEWQCLEAKTKGMDEAWRHMLNVCVIGTAPSSDDRLAAGLDPSCKLPADETPFSVPRVALASLDVNIGWPLPAEELSGQHKEKCAFLSNVCCAPGARRMGAARSLIDFAAHHAAARGVRHLYVHVAVGNPNAAALYMDAGFSVEAEESTGEAHLLGRPRRLLLYRAI
jgi:ribosomal protein S18 acetylase RimI-like enzyme